MTKAEQIRLRVDELVDAGARKVDAYEAVAKELSLAVNTVRGSYYRATKAGGNGKRHVRETTPDSAARDAVAILSKAIAAIDEEIVAAAERAEEAKTEYESLRASAETRKAAIQSNIDAIAS